MAHFAKLDENNFVVYVLPGRDEDTEQNLTERTGEKYVQTSYNTDGGIHYTEIDNQRVPSEDQSKAFRKNFASIGDFYDETRDAFIAPKPYKGWVLNEDTCQWEAPRLMPDDGNIYVWNEDVEDWVSAGSIPAE